MSICRSAARDCASALSTAVVVGERNSSVSEMMHDSIKPLIASGMCAAWSPIRLCMIVAVQASGRIVMSIGPAVSRPPTSLWWSMIAITFAPLMLAGNSAGLLVSTITTSWPSATSVMICGRSKPQRVATNPASVFGVPKSRASAVLPVWFMNHSQISGEPRESVSGDLCPKIRVVIVLFR